MFCRKLLWRLQHMDDSNTPAPERGLLLAARRTGGRREHEDVNGPQHFSPVTAPHLHPQRRFVVRVLKPVLCNEPAAPQTCRRAAREPAVLL